MIRLSKLTDYAFVVMTQFAKHETPRILTAKDVAEASGLPLPTVSKILKMLSKTGFLEAKRGVNGGYQLACDPAEIKVGQLIEVYEGPIALTDCIAGTTDGCLARCRCKNGTHWKVVNDAICEAFQKVSIKDMAETGRI